MGEEKMSKSLGNLVTIKDALNKYGADALRVFVLGSHYRSPLTYSEEVIEAAARGAERLERVVSRDDMTGDKGKTVDAEPYRKQFIEAMNDDFNTPKALAALFDLAREINLAADKGTAFAEARSVLKELAGEILGLKLESSEEREEQASPEEQERINKLIEERTRLRKEKQWQQADDIRNELGGQGIILEDTPQGTIWKKKR
jgi:cysteinyl-tRNA synthetase